MRSVLQYQFTPAAWGVAACLLSLVLMLTTGLSAWIPGWINTVILLLILFICIHLVRGTAKTHDKHVWEIPPLAVLICMPVFNLAVAALQMVSPDAPFLNNAWFSLPLAFFSLPAFFCGYFFYAARAFRAGRPLRVALGFLYAAGAGYVLLQLTDKLLLPLLRIPVPFVPGRLGAALSAAVYGLGALCFVLLRLEMGRGEKAPEHKNKENL